ncbi:Glyoxalase family protein [Lutibaculum baratangense AMV1]|uniref:Glyoxalase family protein n=1 Tax=Lutibaculum baratangense AMV1 TaxID=631454 RepID=V4RCP8_9HYPH|nr:Glyoxalase family protein [Lutibaculum baratangense AMV1]
MAASWRPEDEARTRIGAVGLKVRDLDRLVSFYRDAIGLDVVDTRPGEAVLGAGDEALLHLAEDRDARLDDPREAGLFHTAFLLPDRAALGRWLRHAGDTGLQLEGASDHLVSEAVYLSDPEGNGIEIYADRRPEEWQWSEGRVGMETLPLDVASLLAAALGSWTGMPAGATIGHIHLRVGTLDDAVRFYGDGLGFEVVAEYPGARFLSRQNYHHHIGTNIWRSRGSGRRDGSRTGLEWFSIVLDPEGFDALGAKLGKPTGGHYEVEDPWGTRVRLSRTPAS